MPAFSLSGLNVGLRMLFFIFEISTIQLATWLQFTLFFPLSHVNIFIIHFGGVKKKKDRMTYHCQYDKMDLLSQLIFSFVSHLRYNFGWHLCLSIYTSHYRIMTKIAIELTQKLIISPYQVNFYVVTFYSCNLLKSHGPCTFPKLVDDN